LAIGAIAAEHRHGLRRPGVAGATPSSSPSAHTPPLCCPGDPNGRVLGFGITEVPIWLLAAGAMSALAGALVAPLAVRLRGLYLAMSTLGLGLHRTVRVS